MREGMTKAMRKEIVMGKTRMLHMIMPGKADMPMKVILELKNPLASTRLGL